MNSSNSLNLDDLLNDDTKAQSLVNTLTSQLKISQDTTQMANTTTVVNNLLQEIDSEKTKTAVSVLQEICAKSRLDTPVYEITSTSGNPHEPIFNLKATIGDLVVTASGNSKKKAKHSAALNMISLLNQLGKNNSIVQQIEKVNQNKSSSSNRQTRINRPASSKDKREKSKNNDATKTSEQIQQINTEPDDKFSNPIGDLIEITQKFSINPPKYEFDESEGPAHNRVFVCHVKFGDFKESGYGKTKKLAKRQAALKMIESLKSFSYLNQDFSVNNSNINNNNNNNVNNSNSKPSRPNGRAGKLSIFNSFTKLRLSTNPKIKNLLEPNVNIDTFVLNRQYFDGLAQEENIEFKYHIVHNKNSDGKRTIFLVWNFISMIFFMDRRMLIS
jgi:RISC-loading complex subunit TARBP2